MAVPAKAVVVVSKAEDAGSKDKLGGALGDLMLAVEQCLHTNLEKCRPIVLPKDKPHLTRRKSRGSRSSRDLLIKDERMTA